MTKHTLQTPRDIAKTVRKPIYSVRYFLRTHGWENPDRYSPWLFTQADAKRIVGQINKAKRRAA